VFTASIQGMQRLFEIGTHSPDFPPRKVLSNAIVHSDEEHLVVARKGNRLGLRKLNVFIP
jgi:hypothetical protein